MSPEVVDRTREGGEQQFRQEPWKLIASSRAGEGIALTVRGGKSCSVCYEC